MAQPSLPARANYIRLVRQSEAVTEARLDPFLDGAVLAAEQVQDVRISVLETPKEVTNAEFWTEIAITVLIESNVATKIVSKVVSSLAKATFGRVIQTTAVFTKLPKSDAGARLLAYANFFEDPKILKNGFANLPGLAGAESLKLFSPGVRRFATVASSFDYAKATVKVANQLRNPGNRPRKAEPLSATDSAGVAVLHGALDYATNLRLANRFGHAVLEQAVWSVTTIDELVQIGSLLDWEALSDPDDREAFALGQSDIRRKVARFFEALIWARMYAFSTSPPGTSNNPYISPNESKPFTSIDKRLQMYWQDRFQNDANDWAQAQNLKRGKGNVDAAEILRRYFATIAYEVGVVGSKIGAAPLSATAPAGGQP